MVGEMFFVHQKFVRCAAVENGWAWLQHIDLDGVVQISSAPVSALRPVREFMASHTAWPEGGNLDVLEVERQQQWEAAIRKAERKAQVKVSRKARRSHKIKRGVPA